MAAAFEIVMFAAGVLVCAAAADTPPPPMRAKYSVVKTPGDEPVETAQYRVVAGKGLTMVSIFAGEKPTAGYEIGIREVTRDGNTCTVRYRIEGPPRDAMVAQVITYPSITIRISPACRTVKVDPPLPQGDPSRRE